jgi:hypothetical protein
MAALVLLGAAGADPARDFLREHWRRPLAPQGPPPERYTPLEASLEPEACGTCHPAQLADWRTSLHARSMGPGVVGQLVEMLDSDPDAALSCFTCHAPLAEQAPLVIGAHGPDRNPAHVPALLERGVVCAACHVRAHRRYGPPRRDGTVAPSGPPDTLAHGGVARTSAFLRSEFCRGCHQFEPGGFALNGKLLEDTYAEWARSRFAREGVQCQDCHMPDRRHLWRGIHDPDMVRRGVTITLTPGRRPPRPAGAPPPPHRPGDTFTATLRVANTGVGHAFPTYVTPRVVLRAELVDAGGQVVPGSREETLVERHIALDLSREHHDTRLAPGQSATLTYRRRVAAPGLRARFTVVVEPDAFYTRFFETLLEQGAGRGTDAIRRALDDTRRSPFTIFDQALPVS